MIKALMTILMGIMVSFYFFPIEFTFLPGVNTKMAMAGFGLVVLAVQMALRRKPYVDEGIFRFSAIAIVVSLFGLLSITYNETHDYTYATYIVSMWVWLSGAYVVVTLMRALHGYVSVELVCNYLIAVCTAQCILALMIDSIPTFKAFVDTYVSGFGFVDTSRLRKSERLYGIGAGLDVAGLRFSAVLCSIAFITSRIASTTRKNYISVYLICFVIIGLVGNMIARTTTVGVILAIAYWIYALFRPGSRQENSYLWKWLAGVIVVALLIIVPLYNVSPTFKANTRFAFEGFFSLAEKGRWEVHSNEILKNMYVFPDNLKTWIIGDGYMENPRNDPYYTGEIIGGYYMGTDVGYLRFIFYFGLLGLLSFIYYFIAITKNCMKMFPAHKLLFLLFLAVNMIGWLKVSTDIFLVFAPFLLISKEENEAAEQQLMMNDD
ncbi:MAG: hypothetical protein IKJ92_09495 [Bacteroidaceae bacterium]|nr:hypothetical protein [Bacteroidaceae bacterium]